MTLGLPLRSMALLLLGLALPSAAHALINVGSVAPNFTKTRLGGGSVSLSDYNPGKVVVLFLLGYD